MRRTEWIRNASQTINAVTGFTGLNLQSCIPAAVVERVFSRPGDNSPERSDALLLRVWLWHHRLWSYRYGNATLGDSLVSSRRTDYSYRHHVAHLVGERPQEPESTPRDRSEAIAQRRREQGDGGARCAVGRRGQRKSGRFVGDGSRPRLQMSGKCLDSWLPVLFSAILPLDS